MMLALDKCLSLQIEHMGIARVSLFLSQFSLKEIATCMLCWALAEKGHTFWEIGRIQPRGRYK